MEFKRACLATRLILLAFGLGMSSWAPMVPYAKMRLGVDDAQLGMILLVFGIGALCAMPVAGWLVHRFGSRPMTFFSGLVVIGLLPFLAVAHTSLVLSLVLFLFGASTGALNVSINAQAVEVESRSPVSVMSGFHCLFSTGGLLGALLVSMLLEYGVELFVCALVISVIMSLLLLSQWKNLLVEKRSQPIHNTPGKFVLPEFKILFLGILCFIAFMAEGAMLDWSAEFLRSVLHYDVSIAGIGYAIFSIAMASGRLFGDKLIEKFGILAVFQMGSWLAASGFLVVTYLSWGYGELMGFCLIGLGASNIVPILFSSSGKFPSSSSSYVLTIVTTLGYVGMLGGPAFIGFLAQATSLSFAFACLSLLLLGVGMSGRKALAPLNYQLSTKI